jgi:hypothetical protein
MTGAGGGDTYREEENKHYIYSILYNRIVCMSLYGMGVEEEEERDHCIKCESDEVHNTGQEIHESLRGSVTIP